MKFNNKELADLSSGEGTIEGRLHHKKCNGGYSHSVFKEKWFKLRANILFYFNISETGQIFDKKPVGAFILENVVVQYEMHSEVPFSFSFYFIDEMEKKHLFAGRTQENINQWVEALQEASYEYWRFQLMLLQEKLKLLTGQDPLLMYPRNAGCKQDFNIPLQEKCHREKNKSQFHTGLGDDLACNSGSREIITSISTKMTINQGGALGNLETALSQIISNPPIRPARGNKPRQEVNCGKLVDI